MGTTAVPLSNLTRTPGFAIWAIAAVLTITSQSAEALTLTGATRAPSLANADVQIEVGQAGTVAGQTDSNGRFSIEIDCTIDPDAFVVVKINGTGDQADWGLARAVHSCAHLETEAAPANSFKTGSVDVISTAVYSVLTWELLSASINVDNPGFTQVAPFQATLDFRSISRVIQVIAQWQAGTITSLPEGATNTLEWATNLELLESSAAEYYFEPLENWQTEYANIVFNDSSYIPPQDPSVPTTLATYCPVVLIRCAFSAYLDAGGVSGQYGTAEAGGTAAIDLLNLGDIIFASGMESIVSGLRVIRIRGEGGGPLVEQEGFPFVDGVGQVRGLYREDYKDIRVADASEYFTVLAVGTARSVVYPDNPEIPTEINEVVRLSFTNGAVLGESAPPWPTPVNGEERILAFIDMADYPNASAWSIDRVVFMDDGTAQAQRLSRSYDWALDNSELVLTALEQPEYRYRLLSNAPFEDVFPYLVTVRESGVVTHTSPFLGMVANSPEGWELADVPGRYIDGRSLVVANPSFPFQRDYLIVELNADGTGCFILAYDPLGELENCDTQPLTWALNARNEVEIRRRLSTTGTSEQWRVWARARLTANGDLYVIEVGPIFSDGPIEVPYTTGRLNLYRKLVLP